MRYANGKIAQFMDAYIRQHKVWTPEQMLESFIEKLEETIQKRHFNTEYDNGEVVWSSEKMDRWLGSAKGQILAKERMVKKYEKDKPIAIADSPLVERVRFGFYWDKSKYFDISYGLKLGSSYVETEELRNYPHRPWIVSHVEQQLGELYKCDLSTLFGTLCRSPIEQAFYEYWLENYYHEKGNPALIPEVCGFRARFFHLEYKGMAYSTYSDLPPVGDPSNVKTKNFRFDFFVANTRRKRAILIELDGHEHHKTKPQRIVDSIKRNEAASHGIPVVVFTGTQIKAGIEGCFKSIEEVLTK